MQKIEEQVQSQFLFAISLSKQIHQNAVDHGWWDEPRSFDEIIALIHSEWSEALEEDRAGRPGVWYTCMDDHYMCHPRCMHADRGPNCPDRASKPEGWAVELIDGCIRILDYMGWCGYKYADSLKLNSLVKSARRSVEKWTLPEPLTGCTATCRAAGSPTRLKWRRTISVIPCTLPFRGVSHELVRRRLASYAQESTRYCNYSKGKFDGEITVINPFGNRDDRDDMFSVWCWKTACQEAEEAYMLMLDKGITPELARSVLPHSLKTEVVMTANMREWRHFFKLRALGVTGRPHPQMVQVAMPLLKECAEAMPELFGDLMEGAE